MGATTTVTSGSKAVGSELASVLPQDNKRWWQRGHLIKLNFVILSLVQFASTNGYDGSIMNGLQVGFLRKISTPHFPHQPCALFSAQAR